MAKVMLGCQRLVDFRHTRWEMCVLMVLPRKNMEDRGKNLLKREVA